MNVLKTAAIVLALGAVNIWAGADEGKETDKANQEHGSWPDICHKQPGSGQAQPAHRHQEVWPLVPRAFRPAHRTAALR